MKNKGFRILQIILSILILIILFYSINVSSFAFQFTTINYYYLIFSILVLPLSLFPRSSRWQMFMNFNQQDSKVSHSDSFKLMLIGTALNMFMPAGMGDIAKSYWGYKWSGIKERMLSISIYDKIIAIASLSILSFAAMIYTGEQKYLITVTISLLPWLTIISLKTIRTPFLENFYDWINRRIKKIDIRASIRFLGFPKRIILWGFFLSILGWLIDYLLLFFCFNALNIPIPLTTVIWAGPILTLGRLFPFTFNGIGTDEMLIVYLFSQSVAGAESELLAGAIIYRLLMLVLPALAGTYFLLKNKKSNKS